MYNPNKYNFNKMIEKGFNTIINMMEKFTDNVSESESSLGFNVEKVGDYLFNRQSASNQLWASSPITGPSRFNIENNKWIHYKTKIPLNKFLENEIEKINDYNTKKNFLNINDLKR
ncbi:frataxin [Vairimorpha apis BRL 01]|uniref:Frataxin n=1 Tax=Vairimorpha apis BRL 01 TaxID=1037528 RepID=T0KZG1_9MICR|nr:frataxin [Vairimorpha apis BRL 01]